MARPCAPLTLLAFFVAEPGAWADVPGMSLLRPSVRASFARSTEGMPIYSIDQALDDVSGTFSARLELTYVNRTGEPLAKLPLRLAPNAAGQGLPGGRGAPDAGERPGGKKPGKKAPVFVEAGRRALEILEIEAGAGTPTVAWSEVRPTLVEVTFARPIPPGARLVLDVNYRGHLKELGPDANDALAQASSSFGSMLGTGTPDYGLLATGDGITTVASAYPMVAPFRRGAFDTSAEGNVGDLTYNEVAAFSVRTYVPAGMKVVTNLVDRPSQPGPEGSELVESEGAFVRDFVLVGGRDLVEETAEVGETRVRAVHLARDDKGGRVVLEVAKAALESFERRFGLYPYAELDVVEASLVGGAGGVEFCSFALVAGTLYRPLDESASPIARLMKLAPMLMSGLGGRRSAPGQKPASPFDQGTFEMQREFTVAHEVAHQYFAGIVGNDSKLEAALDEPLAQYAAELAFEDRHGKEAAKKAANVNVKLSYALYRLMGGADRPADRPTTNYRKSIEYGALVYGKAPYLYTSLRAKLGDAKTSAIIRAGVTKYRFQLAPLDGWIDTLASAAGEGQDVVRAAFSRYLEESHGDEDLGVDDSGDFVIDTLAPPETAMKLRMVLARIGMKPKDLAHILGAKGLDEGGPVGPGIDPEAIMRALKQLQRPHRRPR